MSSYHGYSLAQLNESLRSRLDLDGDIRLRETLLEGWSSLNILGYVNQTPAFVMKLPKSSEITSFNDIFVIQEKISKFGLCPKPLYHGSISDEDNLPVLVIEYVEGRTYASPFDIVKADFCLLEESLKQLADIRLPGVPKHSDAVDHLNAIARPLELQIYDYGRNLTSGLHEFFAKFITLADISRTQLEGCDWNPVTIHGDLYERNIIFQEDRATLLDMEECCVSDRFYDRVYLFAQSYTEKILSEEDPLKGSCTPEHWLNLEILALCSVITWSLRRLLELELGLIELHLSRMVSDDMVREYVREKLEILSVLLKS